VIESVVDATEKESVPISKKTILTPQARRELMSITTSGDMKPSYLIFDRLSDHEVARQLGLDLGTADAPCLAIDLIMGGQYLGLAAVTNTRGLIYTPEHGQLLLELHAPLAATALIFHQFRQLSRVRELMDDRDSFLNQELMRSVEYEIIGAEFGLKEVVEMVEKVASTDSPVLLLGETGVGKEVIAGLLHRSSPRANGPFINVNCGSIPQGLLESELFGHEKGAFTGASSSRKGYFERADGGTIFLDEVGELSNDAQVRLLRVLQDKRVERIGGGETLFLDIRVIAATNRDLRQMAAKGEFRQDLFFRLNVFPITIPPLRMRREDIPSLAYHFVAKKARDMALPDLPKIYPGAVDRLMKYDWPGNVRELENVIEREIIVNKGRPITFDYIGDAPSLEAPATPPRTALNLDQVIVEHVTHVLKMTGGKVEGPGGAAELLGMNPRTLQSRMKKMGIPHGRKAKAIYG
jgi:transcriptional regulator with GAF, ATPase, and Fis domain